MATARQVTLDSEEEHSQIEPLFWVIGEQGEGPFRHKGLESKSQNSQGSGEPENCNLEVGSTIFVNKNAAESKP